MAELLLRHGAKPNRSPNSLKQTTVLGLAISLHRLDVVKLLFDHGALVDDETHCEDFGRDATGGPKPVHVATLIDTNILDFLLNNGAKADTTCRLGDIQRITPLHLAFDEAAAKRLISAGASVFAVDSQGETPLFWAVKAWLEAALRAGKPSRKTEMQGWQRPPLPNWYSNPAKRAIVWARNLSLPPKSFAEMRDGAFAAIKVLLAHGSPVNLRDGKCNTPLYYLSSTLSMDGTPREGALGLAAAALLEASAELDVKTRQAADSSSKLLAEEKSRNLVFERETLLGFHDHDVYYLYP